MNCKNCRWFVKSGRFEYSTDGDCRFHAPKLIQRICEDGLGWAETEFPSVDASWFCGDFSDRPDQNG